MAKVVGPLHSSEARGRMGGLIYNTWRGVATVKAKHAPCQPRSTLQLAIRAVAVSLIRAWAAVVDKAAWNTYAAAHPTLDGMGNSMRATGANWYVALGTRLTRLGIPVVATPPAIAAPAAITGFTAVGGAGSITPDWTTPSAHTNSVEIWFDGAHSAGRQGSLPKARYNCAPWGDEGGLVLSGLAGGTYDVYARVISRTDGQASPWVSARCTVT